MDEGPVVSNTTPLIMLTGVRLLDLLPQLYGEIWVAEAVAVEYSLGRRSGDPDLRSLAWLRIAPVLVEAHLLKILDAGEAATIALALASRARIVLVDEKAGRQVAQRYGLPVVGTLAVLLRAKEQGLIQEVKSVVDEMIRQGRHIRTALRTQLLRAAGEE